MSRPAREFPLPIVDLFGMPIARIDLADLLNYFHSAIDGFRQGETGSKSIVYANARSCVLFQRDVRYRQAMLAADLVYTDGNGPRLAARLAGDRLPPRMTGPDWIDELCQMCARHGHRLYLLGASPGVAERASHVLRERHPDLRLVGSRHGFFSSADEQGLLEEIQSTDPDLLILGMGSPRQEIWLMEHKDELQVPVMWAAGGALGYAAGTVRRPPLWMRRLSNGLAACCSSLGGSSRATCTTCRSSCSIRFVGRSRSALASGNVHRVRTPRR